MLQSVLVSSEIVPTRPSVEEAKGGAKSSTGKVRDYDMRSHGLQTVYRAGRLSVSSGIH